MRARESRPSETTEAASSNEKIIAANDDTLSIPDKAELDAILEHIAGALVLVVEVAEDRYRRRVYLSAAAAERAAHRAVDQGHEASVYVAQLRPVHRINGGGLL